MEIGEILSIYPQLNQISTYLVALRQAFLP